MFYLKASPKRRGIFSHSQKETLKLELSQSCGIVLIRLLIVSLNRTRSVQVVVRYRLTHSAAFMVAVNRRSFDLNFTISPPFPNNRNRAGHKEREKRRILVSP